MTCGECGSAPKSSAMTGSWPSCSTASRAAARRSSIPVISELMNTFMEGFYRKARFPEACLAAGCQAVNIGPTSAT